jgi:ABC-2 type transport system permease protein/lipopolysaccharide transport system permease protein
MARPRAASVTAQDRTANKVRSAVADVVDGLANWRIWTKLGWNDILQRYRRSFLGPLWLTASMAIMVISLGVIYAEIFKMSLQNFMPFLCVGLLIWNLISSILTDAGGLFTGAVSYIKQIRLPYSLYVFRFVWSKLIVFAHNLVVYLGILFYFEIWPGYAALYALPGFFILVANGVFVAIYLGIISARFRDVPQITASLVQIAFFVTPVMWKPEFLGNRQMVATLNPFYHLVEIVRAPLLGEVPAFDHYVAVALITAVNALLAGVFFVRYRSRISFWV